jgi:hypothetical protein
MIIIIGCQIEIQGIKARGCMVEERASVYWIWETYKTVFASFFIHFPTRLSLFFIDSLLSLVSSFSFLSQFLSSSI